MASGLKRPLELEMPPHTSGPSGTSPSGSFANFGASNKRRCTAFLQQHSRVDTRLGMHCNSSLFKDSSSILTPLSEDVASTIKAEIRKAAHDKHINGNEAPILTLRQTQIICEKLIKDREQKLRDEYDRILACKLAEQYEIFVKYTHDHIEKHFSESRSHHASYLS